MSDDPDFRIYASFRDSPKRLALEDALGVRGVVALVDLWCWVRANRPSGDLSGLGPAAIETAARWTGKRGQLIAALTANGDAGAPWIEGQPGAYVIHGWGERQGWAKASPARSQAGKVAAIVKQARRHGVTTDQWLDDVGGEDARNDRLRERARQAYDRSTSRGTVRQRIAGDRSTNRSTTPNESLSLVSTPSPSPSPTPSPTGGGRDGGAAAAGSSATRPAAASPADGKPTCAHCRLRATIGPSFDGYRPEGLDVDLCPGHLTEWYQARPKPGAEA